MAKLSTLFGIAFMSAGTLFLSAPAAAQDKAATPDVLQKLYACRDIAEAEARLACYDEGVGRVEQAQQSGDLVAIDKDGAQAIKREAFGFNIPSLPKIAFPSLGGGDDAPDETVVLTIERYKETARGKYIFYMSNGQVWEHIDGQLNRPPRGANQTLHIKPAALGSFMAKVNGTSRPIRVRRRE